jgi:hypothetical protein
MATALRTSTKRVVPAHRDPIRIVPLHLPANLLAHTPEAGAAPAAKLLYGGGPLLASPEVFTVFWGPPWQSAPLSNLLTQVNQFFSFILTSPLVAQLAEYDVGQYHITQGKLLGTATLTASAPAVVSDTAIQIMLQHAISTNAAFPAPNPNLLYFIYMPPGVTVVMGGTKSCQAFCGYHDNISGTIFYAVMPYPNCPGCLGGLSPVDALTSTSSHELCEAITDAVPGSGWYDDHNGEIGDICAWKTKKVGQYTVQLEWSNSGNACA